MRHKRDELFEINDAKATSWCLLGMIIILCFGIVGMASKCDNLATQLVETQRRLTDVQLTLKDYENEISVLYDDLMDAREGKEVK